MQALVALEAAEDSLEQLDVAETAVENAFIAGESFAESQHRTRCFDDASSLLEQAEVRVEEAESAMEVGSALVATRVMFQEALERYENILYVTVAPSNFGACDAAFSGAREIDQAANKAHCRVHTSVDCRWIELTRLDRPAAFLAALDLSELTEAKGDVPGREVAEGVRNALSVSSAACEDVTEGPQEQEGGEKTALAGRVDDAVQVASTAERAFREAQGAARQMGRWRQELACPEAEFARVRHYITVLSDADFISTLCAASMERAEEALKAAREGVVSIGKGGKPLSDIEAMMETAKARVRRARQDAEEQVIRFTPIVKV